MYYFFYETVSDDIIECIETYNRLKTKYLVTSPIFVKEKADKASKYFEERLEESGLF